MSNEISIASAKASVMLYDDNTKKWLHSGSSSGVSKVHIYQNIESNTFRIVGRKLQDHEVVINCSIFKSLKYSMTTMSFHQWRDNRQIYGLNFINKDDAENFANAMNRALKSIGGLNIINNNSNNRVSYQTPSNYQVIGPSSVSLDEYAEYRGSRVTNNENGDWKSPTPDYAPYASTAINHSSHPTTPGSASSPSGAYGHHRTSSAPMNAQPLSAPYQPSCQIEAPPPPPPPPPLGNLSGLVTLPRQNSKTDQNPPPSAMSLASALATAKLKKTPSNNKANDVASNETRIPAPIGNMASIMDEMTRTLARRRAQVENQDRESIGSNDSGKTGDRSLNATSTCSPSKSGADSPQFSNRSRLDSLCDGDIRTVTAADLEKVKQDILAEMKKEVNKLKHDLIEIIRSESNKR